MSAPIIWLIVGFVLLIAEILSLTFFLLWLALGAFAGALAAWLAPDSFFVQALAAVIVAAALTGFTRPLTRKFRRSGKGYEDAIDHLVGKQGIVVEAIEEGKPGIVKVGSEMWSAVSDETLDRNDTVIIIRRGTAQVEVQKWGGNR
ncbi:NfeD family protein [Cohnella sp. AR92]|uniref:NfeD family protein n=1 Tax=Cohnella sp. AR92 TaxID=648716 RepID=UPI000F8E25D2|nr:NfeD family protein [Cohnella sp. AR92]RUS45387.1 NfeD family protein [Cohnella sp. AR92]